jgi:cellulase
MQYFASTLVLLASATAVAGHATFQEIWSNGVDQVALGARLPLSNSPVQDVTSNDMRCNAGTSAVAGIVEVTGMRYLCFRGKIFY